MLRLSDEYVAFEVGSRLSDIFYDNVNKKICTVRSNGAKGVTAKGFHDTDNATSNIETASFRLVDAGKIQTIAYATDLKIVALHRENNIVSFAFLDDLANKADNIINDYRLNDKPSTTRIIGLQWLNEKQLVYVTENGLELYQLNPKRRTTKLIRTVSLAPAWFVTYVSFLAEPNEQQPPFSLNLNCSSVPAGRKCWPKCDATINACCNAILVS